MGVPSTPPLLPTLSSGFVAVINTDTETELIASTEIIFLQFVSGESEFIVGLFFSPSFRTMTSDLRHRERVPGLPVRPFI